MPQPALTHTHKTRRLIIAACVMLGILLAAIALVWWSDRQQDSAVRSSPASTTHSLRIERPGLPALVLDKQTNDLWHITAPCEMPVNNQRLLPFLDALSPAAHSYPSSEVDLEAAGLITPEALIFLNEQRLALGGTDLTGERRYLQRGDRVEFVPEWLLSMVNGGLSAIATLELFPEGLQSLSAAPSRTEGSSAYEADPQTLALWEALAAQQVVSWPLPDTETAISSRQLTADIAGQRSTLTLHDFQRFIAIRFENAACAYILSRTSLPDSVFP